MASNDLATSSTKLHPFFTSQRTGSTDDTLPANAESITIDIPRAPPYLLANKGGDCSGHEANTAAPRQKRGLPDGDDGQNKSEKRRKGRTRKNLPKSSTNPIVKRLARQIQDARPSPSSGNDTEGDEVVPEQDEGLPPLVETPASSLNVEATSSILLVGSKNVQDQTPSSRPKRMLQLNPKTGTIGSPPKPKEVKPDTQERNGANKTFTKSSEAVFNGTLKVKYGEDDESRVRIGRRIDAILATSPAAKRSNRPRQQLTQTVPDTTNTHPFFLGKPQKSITATPVPVVVKSPSKPKGPTSRFSSTPCSPKKSRLPQPAVRVPQFGFKNGGVKVPGSSFPAWPWMGIAHVRSSESQITSHSETQALPLSLRKSKGYTVSIGKDESVLEDIAYHLNVPAVLTVLRNSEEFLPPPSELRLPQKHFESGHELQRRILPQLSQQNPTSSALYESIKTSLSAFDRSECENLSWPHKYAPSCAADVIQIGKEPLLLREWLRALQLRAVDTTPSESSSKHESLRKDANAKRKRRSKLEGFVVSSDEESNGMEELSESDTDWSPSGCRGVTKRTVIRAGDTAAMRAKNGARLTNAVVISGPHGCGKTAAVYAIAKELGFEIFEINAGSRRGGKEVLEKIGDMTKNHLVNPQETGKSAPEADAISEAEVSQEIMSGKQATMNAFFQAKPRAKSVSAKVPKLEKPPSPEPATTTESKKATSKAQKQSLILLEEADILYQDDKQFWATVMLLITQSKRPFIMTCNDETLLPLLSLNLHGIFRFLPPPHEPAVDRLIMIAANEGHSLDRNAVDALFASHRGDFRATLTELNFWCQTGVGDRRGGFDWFYPRWPRGVDLDEYGRTVRVVSASTYQEGMGWFDRDVLSQGLTPERLNEELIQQAWTHHGLDMSDLPQPSELGCWPGAVGPATSPGSRLALLEAYDDFAGAMSFADIASSSAFASEIKEPTDVMQPALASKIRDDYTIGLPLLETPTLVRYETLTVALPITLRSMAHRILRETDKSAKIPPTTGLGALQERDVINCIQEQSRSDSTLTCRMDFALAFDPIAASDSQAAAYLDPSVFDGTFEPVVLDVAPYVRGIVAYDNVLQKQRLKLSNLVSEGGRGAKRMRTTRAAMSALEGGQRSTTRKERWFKANLNNVLVKETAGEGWAEAVAEEVTCSTREGSIASTGGHIPPDSATDGESGPDGGVDELA